MMFFSAKIVQDGVLRVTVKTVELKKKRPKNLRSLWLTVCPHELSTKGYISCSCSLMDGFGLGIKGLTLSRLAVHSAEACQSKGFPCLLHGFCPALDVFIIPLACCGSLFGDNLSIPVFDKMSFGKAGLCLLLIAPEDHCLRPLPLCNF